MVNQTDERIRNLFREVSPTRAQGEASPAGQSTGEAHAEAFDPSLSDGPGESYHGTSTSASSSSSGTGGNALESVAGEVFGGALGLIPLVGGLLGLFDSKSTQQPVFEKYQLPSSIGFEAAETSNGLANSDYGQMGLPRVYDAAESASSGSGSATSTSAPVAGASTSGGGAASQAGSPQISVNVQAMDAQSFMSYSGEIAKAVRDAMLNLSSLNDVVSDL